MPTTIDVRAIGDANTMLDANAVAARDVPMAVATATLPAGRWMEPREVDGTIHPGAAGTGARFSATHHINESFALGKNSPSRV